jgi:hypothetical protein
LLCYCIFLPKIIEIKEKNYNANFIYTCDVFWVKLYFFFLLIIGFFGRSMCHILCSRLTSSIIYQCWFFYDIRYYPAAGFLSVLYFAFFDTVSLISKPAVALIESTPVFFSGGSRSVFNFFKNVEKNMYNFIKKIKIYMFNSSNIFFSVINIWPL